MRNRPKETNLDRKRAYWLVNDPALKNQIQINFSRKGKSPRLSFHLSRNEFCFSIFTYKSLRYSPIKLLFLMLDQSGADQGFDVFESAAEI